MRWALLLLLVGLAPASLASAHGFEVGVLALHELEPGRFAMQWRPPEDSRRPTPARVSLRFPDHCRRHQQELRCGEEGLHGAIAFDELPDPRSPVVVRIERLDGRRLDAVVRGDAPVLEVGRASALVEAIERGARAALHLPLVILALVLVVGLERRGLPALLAFVLGHALGLGLAPLAGLPSAPLTAMGAAGVVLLARGGARQDEARSWLLFALVLGVTLGLAPAVEVPLMGVAGAALTSAVLLAIFALMIRSARAVEPRVQIGAAYAVGVAGALVLIARALALA
jgi:hypothetical protein